MGIQIEDGTGDGHSVKITSEHQMKVQSESHELQHHVSFEDGQVFQAIGEVSDIADGLNTVLHIRNDSTSLKAIVSFIRLQLPGISGLGSTLLPDDGTYFQLGRDTVRSSGGVGVAPVNMNFASGNTPALTAYKDNLVVSGAFQELDRWYPGHSMMTFNKQGSLILGLNDTLEVRLTTDQPALTVAYCRVTIMLKKNGTGA